MSGSFQHFDPSLCQFLHTLSQHNNRAWFKENKTRYEHDALDPMLGFIAHMSHVLPTISPHFHAIPKKQGGSLFRIYRDARFTKNKRPYNEHMSCRFSHSRIHGVHSPCFFFRIDTTHVSMGAGIWQPMPQHLQAIREAIRDRSDEWTKVKRSLFSTKSAFNHIEGQSLKRSPRGFDDDHKHSSDIKLKSFFVVNEEKVNMAMQDTFMDALTKHYRCALPLMAFLCKSLSLPC